MSTDQTNLWLVSRDGDEATIQVAAYNPDTPFFFISKAYLLQAISQEDEGVFDGWELDRFDEVDEEELERAEREASEYIAELRVEEPRNCTIRERTASHIRFTPSSDNAAPPLVNGDGKMHPVSGDENDEDGPCRRLRALPPNVPWTLIHVRGEGTAFLDVIERLKTFDTLVHGPMLQE